jgi:uncharacterized integral membrane protein
MVKFWAIGFAGILLVLFVAFFVNVSAIDLVTQSGDGSRNISGQLATGGAISDFVDNKEFRTKFLIITSVVLLVLILLFFILVSSVFRK